MMEGVSITQLLRLLGAALLAAAVLGSGHMAAAGAASLEDMLSGTLTPSAAPALLGPITSEGRVGWACKPERAAAAAPWRQAELPPDPSTP
jgi:hypothetical protein